MESQRQIEKADSDKGSKETVRFSSMAPRWSEWKQNYFHTCLAFGFLDKRRQKEPHD